MMKRLITSMLLALLAIVSMKAARALSEPFTVTQPDGTTLTVILHGDEHFNWHTTTDSIVLVQTAQGAYHVAAIDDRGAISATAQLAHSPQLRSAAEQQLCVQQQTRTNLFFTRGEQLMQQGRRAQIATNGGYFPHTGTPKTLVILANFSDVKFTSTDPKTQFEMYCNADTQTDLGQNEQKNLTSVRQYFEQSSHGKFSPQFTVVGPIDLPQTMEYYGKSAEGSSSDANFGQFCRDAIAAVDGQVDFNDYDNDGDGRAELVCVIYAGYGQNFDGNPTNSIWPKCGSQNITTADDKKSGTGKVTVTFMNCAAELLHVDRGTDICGNGTFIHEFSHGMGLSDHYVLPSNKAVQVNNQCPEFWDLMDYGEHAANGYQPVPYTAWEQEVMGWITVEELKESQNISNMQPLLKDGKAYKFGNGANAEEWMYLENAQAPDAEQGIIGFYQGRCGHGLLVSHVAYGKSTVSMGDMPNNQTAGHPLISIVPADGLVIHGDLRDGGYTSEQYYASLKGDPFPGTSAVTTLTADMGLPNYRYYNRTDGADGEETPKQSLTNITESTDGAISFYFNDGSTTGIRSVDSGKRTVLSKRVWRCEDSYYNLRGQRVQNPTRGLYITQGKKAVIK